MKKFCIGDDVRLKVKPCRKDDADRRCSHCEWLDGRYGTLILERNDDIGHDWLVEVDGGLGRAFFNVSEIEHAGRG